MNLAEFVEQFAAKAPGTEWVTDGSAIREKGTGRCAIEYLADTETGSYNSTGVEKLDLDRGAAHAIVAAFDRLQDAKVNGSVRADLREQFDTICKAETVGYLNPPAPVYWTHNKVIKLPMKAPTSDFFIPTEIKTAYATALLEAEA